MVIDGHSARRLADGAKKARRHEAKRTADAALCDILTYLQSLHEVADASMARWEQHVEIARLQTEYAGGELSRGFCAVLAQLQAMLDTRPVKATDGIQEVIGDSSEALVLVLKRFRCAFARQRTMLDQFNNLSVVGEDLQRLAAGITDIARQTEELALGVAAEAAQAGAAGPRFVAVVEQVRRLAWQSGRLGQDMVRKVDVVSLVCQRAVSTASLLTMQSDVLMDNAEQTVGQVLARIREVALSQNDSAERTAAGSRMVREHVELIMVHLQFQDRVSQILNVVCSGINDLLAHLRLEAAHIAEGVVVQPFDVPKWIADIERTYATIEQRDRDHPTGKPEGGDADVTFF